jgi:hypothetical protein
MDIIQHAILRRVHFLRASLTNSFNYQQSRQDIVDNRYTHTAPRLLHNTAFITPSFSPGEMEGASEPSRWHEHETWSRYSTGMTHPIHNDLPSSHWYHQRYYAPRLGLEIEQGDGKCLNFTTANPFPGTCPRSCPPITLQANSSSFRGQHALHLARGWPTV